MSSLARLPAGYEDLLRAGQNREKRGLAPAHVPHPALAQLTAANSMDIQQMSDMLDAQFRLREAAQASQAQAVRALIAAAEALCPSQWDGEKRDGHNPEAWAPDQIGEFIVRHARFELQRAYTAQQPDLLAEYERTSRELTAAREEAGRLRLQLQHALAAARTTAEQLGPAVRGRRGDRAERRPMQAQQVEPEPPAPPDVEPSDTRLLDAVPPDRLDAVIRLIAGTGLSRSDEIRERLAADWGVHRGSSRVGLPVRAAVHYGLVEAYPCVVEWPGEKTRQFLVLTPAGRARAVELSVVPVESEYETGIKIHKTADHLYLVLKAADILRAEGFAELTYLPECFQVAGGEYCPDIATREDGRIVYVECERSQDKAREPKWSRAGQANGGTIRLVTPNRKIMDAITSEIKATTGSEYKIWAFNVSEYAAGNRGPNGSIWTHQR